MSAELGIGVRVRIGWAPTGRMPPFLASDPRMQVGTITDGPFFAGDRFWRPQMRHPTINGGPSARWRVDLDNGEAVFPVAWLIFPIDDGDETKRTEHREEETA